MKKMLVVFLLLVGSCFADWILVSGIDEFYNPTEKTEYLAGYSDDLKSILLVINSEGEICLGGAVEHTLRRLGERNTVVKIKNDKGKVIELEALITTSKSFLFYDKDTKEVIDFLKKSNWVKVATYDEENFPSVSILQLEGFNEQFELYKKTVEN